MTDEYDFAIPSNARRLEQPSIATERVTEIERQSEVSEAPSNETVSAYMRALEDMRMSARAAQQLAADVNPAFKDAMVDATELFADEEARLTKYIEREEER